MISQNILLSDIDIPKQLERWVRLQDMLEDLSNQNLNDLVKFVISNFSNEREIIKKQLQIYQNIRPASLYDFAILQDELNKSNYFVGSIIDIKDCKDPVQKAIQSDDINALVSLSSLNEDIITSNIEVNLCLSATYGATKCFKYLLLQSNQDAQLLAVHAASASGNAEMLRLLQQRGTPIAFGLEAALNGRQNKIVDWLTVEYDADICGVFERSSFNIRAALAGMERSFVSNSQSIAASFAIFAAATNDIPEFLEYVLSKGASLNTVGPEGKTPLHFASASGATECVRVLLKYGADPNAMARYMRPIDLTSDEETRALLEEAMK